MNKLQEEIYSQSVPRVVSRFVKPRAVRFQRCRSHRKSPWRLPLFFGSTHRLARYLPSLSCNLFISWAWRPNRQVRSPFSEPACARAAHVKPPAGNPTRLSQHKAGWGWPTPTHPTPHPGGVWGVQSTQFNIVFQLLHLHACANTLPPAWSLPAGFVQLPGIPPCLCEPTARPRPHPPPPWHHKTRRQA